MVNKDELKEIDIKNRTCYYLQDTMRDRDIHSGDTSYETYKNILIYDILYKTSTGAKPLRFRFDEIDGFIKIYDGIIYLVLFDYGWFVGICDRIKYLIKGKTGIADSVNRNFGRTKINSYNSLPIEKILTFHNVIILITSVVNKDKNEYYYNIFLEKG